MDCLKLYLMVGLPGETDEDIDECVRFVAELSRIVPIALGVAPFCREFDPRAGPEIGRALERGWD
jgi:radical SAM superfamily enzyme YgiQ (UPF0313 family)